MSDRMDSPLPPADDQEFSIDEIEAAYQRALETAEAAEALFPDQDAASPLQADESASSPPSPSSPPVESGTPPEEGLDLPPAEAPLTPGQVIEALLFVGGSPLPARKMADVLGGSVAQDQIDDAVAELNALYASQNRPYEIRLAEGGYRMTLRPEFEPVRQKVYGQGPKEIKLAQDALEVLAFVAYRQPVTRQQLEETEKKNIPGLLRQLLRRELIILERGDGPGEESYRTTARFLQLFGLASIDDLPQVVDFDFK